MPLRGRMLSWCPVLLAFASACAGGTEGSAPVSTTPTSSSPPATEAGQPVSTTAAPATTDPMPTTPTTTTTSPEPATTAVPILLDLEIVEWAEYPYANLADSTNRDTRLEMLVRNPNDVPVEIDTDGLEVRLVNGAGNVVYANPNPTLFIWEGAWVKGGETFPISACVCFDSSGLAREEWDTVDLVAPLGEAVGIVYTDDVTFTLGEWFRLSDRHLGGDSLGADFEVANTSDKVLSSFEVRVTARDVDGRFVGVAAWGSFADRSTPAIDPGASSTGVLPTLIDYFDGPLTYTSEAIGIPER